MGTLAGCFLLSVGVTTIKLAVSMTPLSPVTEYSITAAEIVIINMTTFKGNANPVLVNDEEDEKKSHRVSNDSSLTLASIQSRCSLRILTHHMSAS